ncbi:MAG: zinc ribbon domain-containing protein [Sandaracinus sp.]
MIACPRCSQQLPDHATFCMACGMQLAGGYREPQAPAMSTGPRAGFSRDGMRICHSCGAIAPTDRQACSICAHPFSRLEERAPERADGAYWAMIRTELTCRQCGGKSPIDEPDVEGTVTCLSCHTIQAFDTSIWEEAFAHAHAVADLAGPDPEGRTRGSTSIAADNPYASIGVGNTTSTLELTGMNISGGVMRTRNLAVAVSPGHPLCTVCHTPIDARMEPGARVVTRCPTCGDGGTYSLPYAVTQQYAQLVLAISEDLRVDRPDAQVKATAAGMVAALHCPSCGGAIDVAPGERAATCPFCKTVCRIPQRTLLSLKKQNDRPRPWWALFRGPSPKRVELERGMSAPAEMAFSSSRGDGGGPPLEEPRKRVDPVRDRLDLAIRIAVPLAVLGFVAVVFFLPVVWGWLNGYGSDTPPPPLPFP